MVNLSSVWGIAINCVAPGVIDTQMNQNFSQNAIASLWEETVLGRLGTPKETGFITEQVFSPNSGFVI